ncbi:ClpXP protease specificity-enhancing factor SspB [Magnetococcales bacterium HHB-1]
MTKSDVVRLLLDRHGRVMLCIDATYAKVDVPRRFKQDSGLRLVLNQRMPQPIDIYQDRIESELRFGGIPHFCIIPMASLWGAFNPDSGQGQFWQESMPEAVLEGLQTLGRMSDAPLMDDNEPLTEEKLSVEDESVETLDRSDRFQVIEGGVEEENKAVDEHTSEQDEAKKRPVFRLIK